MGRASDTVDGGTGCVRVHWLRNAVRRKTASGSTTVRYVHFKRKLMEFMRLREDGREPSGRVKIDDACLGGELSGGKAAAKLPQFRAVNKVLSNLKTALVGTCHAFKFAKYAHRYLAEFQYRFNPRFNLRSILRRLNHASCTTSPHSLGHIRG